MINGLRNYKVYLACGATDLRKFIDGLSLIVSESFNLDLFSAALFVFCNRNRTKIKILHWESNGFWLYYKRLEKGTFAWPKEDDDSIKEITTRELRWLLDGIPIEQKSRFKELKYCVVS
jgi:transposase